MGQFLVAKVGQFFVAVDTATDSASSIAMLVTALAWLTVQWTFLVRTGQSLGKRWMKIRVTREDGSPASFTRILVIRSWIVPLVSYLPLFGAVTLFVDPIAIYRQDRRCIHDIWAGTIVVDA